MQQTFINNASKIHP